MEKTRKLKEEIIDIIPFNDLNLKTSILCIMTKSKSKTMIGYNKTEINKYFLLKEVSDKLGYNYKSLNNKTRNISIDDDKYILTRDCLYDKIKTGGYTGFGSNLYSSVLSSIPTRGILIISLSGLCKLIMNSNKPEVKKFQDWIYSFVIPRAIEVGYYLNSDNLYLDLYSKFSKLYYSYEIDPRYASPTVTLQMLDGYSLFMKEHNYFCMVEDYQFQTRIYDIAYYIVFGRTYSSMFSNDPSIYTTKNNPYESARELGGLLGIRSVDSVIKYVINCLELGYSIDYLEQINIPNKNIINTRSILSIPDGIMYKYIQSEKRYKDINNIK